MGWFDEEKTFLKKFEFFYFFIYLKLIFIFVFLYHFDALMLKIIFKKLKKNIISIYFQIKKTLNVTTIILQTRIQDTHKVKDIYIYMIAFSFYKKEQLINFDKVKGVTNNELFFL
jgi:hypothetical protein